MRSAPPPPPHPAVRRSVLLQRQLALAGAALLTALATLALARSPGNPTALQPVGVWYEARVASYGPGSYGTTTACGIELTPQTRGVAHPVLPCGAKLFLSYGGREAAAEVVHRGPREPGREFDVTEALASDLGLVGVQVVRWRFAGADR